MALNDLFKSASSLSPTAKINLDVNSSSLSSAASSVKSALTNQLSSGGLSIPSLSSVSGSLDNMVGNLRSEIPNFAQQSLERIAPSSLISNRIATSADAKQHAMMHDPTTRISDSRGITSNQTVLKYPADLRKYYLSIGIGEYTRPSPYVNSTWQPDTFIYLPIPAGLADTTGVTLNQGSNAGAMGHAVEQLASAITGMGPNATFGSNQSLTESTKDIFNQGIGASYTVAMDFGQLGDSLLGTNLTGTAQQLVGAIPNPHIQVFFQGVNLRTHNFSFKFAPKNVKDSMTVQQIIRLLKASQLPNQKWGAANVMGYPKIVQVSLEPSLEYQTMFYKKCMISNVTANYAPQGVPSFFAGTSFPTHIEMSFQLQEIEILLSEDFGGKSGDFVVIL